MVRLLFVRELASLLGSGAGRFLRREGQVLFVCVVFFFLWCCSFELNGGWWAATAVRISEAAATCSPGPVALFQFHGWESRWAEWVHAQVMFFFGWFLFSIQPQDEHERIAPWGARGARVGRQVPPDALPRALTLPKS